MARNLIICCDGTSNQFGPENTNVVRLVQVLDRDPSKQHVYYDPGLGTLPEPGTWGKLQKTISKICGLAFGAGILWKIGEAYTFLMDYWEPGDKVFLFGFSRGAYSVRVLAGLLHLMGLMPHGNHNLVPYALRYFKAGRAKNSEYWRLCNTFRWTFARRIHESDDDRHFPVHFLGVWDTVSSVGWAWEPAAFPYTAYNPSVQIARHAVSLDERRWFFRQNLLSKPEGSHQDLLELWFPGVHGDVGGGYPTKDGGLWQVPFSWLLTEARNAGLLVNDERLAKLMKPTVEKPWLEPQHESLKGLWWLAEYFPKLTWHETSKCRLPTTGRGRHRYVHDGALLDQSTLLRIRENSSYLTPNLSNTFIERIKQQSILPERLPYTRTRSLRPNEKAG